jgi:hypothetical protein
MKERTHKSTYLALGLVLVALTALLLIPATAAMAAKPVDGDGDGYAISKGDCDDSDSSVNPGAEEICDNRDNNCDGQIDEGDVCGLDPNVDGDDYTVGQGDCDDLNAAINPDALEICDNGIDENCNGLTDEGCVTGEDRDGDGFFDDTELGGITLPDGFILAGTNGTSLGICSDPADKVSPCVHPDRPDLFVIINRASPSNIPSDPLAILRGFTDANGNPVVPHELELVDTSTPPASRVIADGQNAVIVNELLDANFGALGFAPTGGTPNTTTGAVSLYTERIKSEVDRLCGQDPNYPITICDRFGCYNYEVGTCQNEDGSVNTTSGLQALYIQNVLAHETWHVCALAPPDSAEVTLFHFNPNTGWVMEQSIGTKATVAKNAELATVTLYISDTFNTESRAKYKLK